MTKGIISKYNVETKSGTLVLSDGEIKEFTRDNWVDTEWEPAMGQQILYKSDQQGIQIRTITKEEIETLKSNSTKEKTSQEPSSKNRFSSVEESIEHYVNLGFKLATDREDQGKRILSLRFYDQGEFGEALITVDGEKITIQETRNGKPI